jgi:hypothetical protein
MKRFFLLLFVLGVALGAGEATAKAVDNSPDIVYVKSDAVKHVILTSIQTNLEANSDAVTQDVSVGEDIARETKIDLEAEVAFYRWRNPLNLSRTLLCNYVYQRIHYTRMWDVREDIILQSRQQC